MCEKIKAILESPVLCLFFAIIFGIAGLALILTGLLGPEDVFYCRYMAIPFILFGYMFLRVHCRSRPRNRPNQLGARVNIAMDVQTVQQSSCPAQPSCPAPSDLPPAAGRIGETSYGFYGAQRQANSSLANDPSVSSPPPYDLSWGAAHHDVSNLPPPPSYEEVTRGSR